MQIENLPTSLVEMARKRLKEAEEQDKTVVAEPIIIDPMIPDPIAPTTTTRTQ